MSVNNENEILTRFRDIEYDLTPTEDTMCYRITPHTVQEENVPPETVYSLDRYNSVITSQVYRPVTDDNLNSTLSEIEAQLADKVPNARKINGKSLAADVNITAAEIGAEPAFAKNTAFNKNFGTAAGTVCQGNDERLTDSRKCNNTFDNAETARENLGLHKVAASGNYNDLINKPSDYKYFQSGFYAAVAGFSSMSQCSSSSSTISKTLNYKKKYCFVNYGGYTAGMLLNVSGGYWSGESLSFASNFIVIPTYTGSMAGSSKIFYFLTTDGIYLYRANGNDITIQLSRPDCYACGEETLYSY